MKSMVSWRNIVDRFRERFMQAFKAGNKKAHFDFVPSECSVIDGARGKWCNVLLLNALVGQLDTSIHQSAVRRKFNQRVVLEQCIAEEIMAKPAILTSDELEQDQVHVVDIPHEWKSPKSLFNFITVEAPHKSRNKFEVIIDVLRHHAVMSAHKDDLIQLLTLIVSRASQKILKSQTSTKAKSNVEGSGHGREHLLKRRRRENTKPVDNKHADEGIFSTPKTSPRVSTIPDELCTYDTTEEELLLMPIPMDLDDGIVPPIVDMNKMKKMSQKLKFCNGLFIPIEEPPQDHGGIPSCLCDWDFILDDDSCNFALIESANPEADLSDAMSCAHRSWKPFPEEPHRVYLERRSFALQ